MRQKNIYLAGGLLMLAVFSLVKLTGNSPAPETVTVKTGTIVQTVEEFGIVRPAVKHDLYASQPARVVQVPVKNGQSVSQGQTLAITENLDLAVREICRFAVDPFNSDTHRTGRQ
ncbi:biotin/lipoyl-binding protein [Desulforamulus hydrothermalis]|uniref:Efflux transporter, RND family, MFP subunit n=1 Tax=Desulforamulus hydrothermalis Lam5 = DSM 18033 TaxID=1121428 RepID=K8DZP2_9FIRM